jgi:hypothetical protein
MKNASNTNHPSPTFGTIGSAACEKINYGTNHSNRYSRKSEPSELTPLCWTVEDVGWATEG